jgi:diguanylate cyclase (GGDEF)-like protein/PAS domain S-box-containing protein
MFRIINCITAAHDWRLVILAGLICFLASLGAVSLLHRARAAGHVRARALWTLTAGAAAGFGIWATHFIAMLAYNSGYNTAYDIGLTALSLFVAVVVTAGGLGFAVYSPARWSAALGGAMVGGGIASMHYIGMWALYVPGWLIWEMDYVFASILLGMIFGTAALAVAMRGGSLYATAGAALLLALSILSHHFTAMTAMTIIPDPTRSIAPLSLSPNALALSVAAGAVVLLAMALVGAFADRVSEDKARKQNLLFDAALSNMLQGLLMFDAEDRVVLFNQRYAELYRIDPQAIRLGCSFADMLRLREAAGTFGGDLDQYVATLVDEGGRFIGDRALGKFKAEGSETKLSELPDGRCISITNRRVPGGGWVSTHSDITEQRVAERERDRTRAFLDTIVDHVPVTLVVKAVHDRRYVLINRAGENFFGLSRDEMVGKTSHEVFSKAQADIITVRDEELLQSRNEIFLKDHPLKTPGKGTRLITTKKVTIRDDRGEPQYLVNVIEDVTDRKRAEARIEYLANHDALTELPNRAAFTRHLELAVERAEQGGENFAVLHLDLDKFKDVNDIFGHAGGDQLLCEMGRRLQAAAEGAFLARIGGDEFMLIVDGPQPATAEALADKLTAAAAAEIEINGQEFRVGGTIGVAVYPTDGDDATTLLGNANAALNQAKAEARGSIRFFEAQMDHLLRERRDLQLDLRSAAACDELKLYFQPQARIDGGVVGFEALLRWRHPHRGMVLPSTFIPLAEESGLIIPIGEWVLREACREAAAWPKPLQVAVNLSPLQFQHGDLVGLVHSVLLETGLTPNRLELEITENVLIGDFSSAVSILRRLKLLGVRIAMDDFGTGYSSLSYLQSFPFDKIKIDKTFISNLDHNPQSAAIIRAVIGLGRGLQLPVIAEGVETKSQMDFLAREACDLVQGYVVGRPLPIEDYADLVGRRPVEKKRLMVVGGGAGSKALA